MTGLLAAMFANLTFDVKFASPFYLYLGGFRGQLTCFGPYFGRRSQPCGQLIAGVGRVKERVVAVCS